jgi:hypothetical protein
MGLPCPSALQRSVDKTDKTQTFSGGIMSGAKPERKAPELDPDRWQRKWIEKQAAVRDGQ